MVRSPPLPRLAIVLSHPTQYYSPWFRWLKAHTDLEFRVFYLWQFGTTTQRDPQFETSFRWDVDLLSGYEHEFVPNVARDPGTHHFGGLDNPSLCRGLATWEPEAILLFGYKWKSHSRTIAWARWRKIPLLFRGDSHFLGRGPPALLQRLLLRFLFSQFRVCLPVGAANREYFTTLGVPDRRLVFAPHSVNHEFFDPFLPTHRAAAAALRSTLGLSDQTGVVLFAGKFVPAKQPGELLRAFVELKLPDTVLIFVGDGPEKENLHHLAREAASGTVHFLPFANQSEMPAHYLLADMFVLPSRGHYETWGLAVNEAMHMGVPALVSDQVGCQRDLVTLGETGWVFRHDDRNDLRNQLATAFSIMRNRRQAERIRANVRQRISSYTYVQTTAGLLSALASVFLR